MSLRRHLVTALTLLAAAPLLVLAACSGDDTSIADPPISSAPTSSAPTTTQRESAEHFIRRWAAEEERMENTGKTRPYLAISHQCRACQQLASDIHRFYSAGGFAKWGGWTILSITEGGHADRGHAFTVRVHSAPTTYKEAADSPVKHLKGGPATHQVTIVWEGGAWHVIQKAQLAT